MPVARPQPRRMEIGQVMIVTSLAAALALIAPAPEALIRQEVPYSALASGPVSNQPRLLNDQDTALFRQGLSAVPYPHLTLPPNKDV